MMINGESMVGQIRQDKLRAELKGPHHTSQVKISDPPMIKFNKDFHPEFDGWMCEQDKGIIISFIHSNDPGKGNFSKLLKELKEKYDWVRVPNPSNVMRNICFKKGFVSKMEWFPEPFGEHAEMLVWEKKQ